MMHPMLVRMIPASILGFAVLFSAAVVAAAPPKIVLVPTETSAVLEPLDQGVDQWLGTQLVAHGVSVVPTASAPSDLPTLATRIFVDQGEAHVTISLREKQGGAILAVGKESARTELLGGSLSTALGAALAGLPGARTTSIPKPNLNALVDYENAIELMRTRRLRDAWVLLRKTQTATAKRLAERIASLGSESSTPVTERSRLASARGTNDVDWFKIRKGLVKGRDPSFLIAGADAAVAREDLEQAAKLYAEALRLNPNQPEALRARALLLSEGGDEQAARSAANQALAALPDDPALLEALASNGTLPQAERKALWIRAGDQYAQGFETQKAFEAWRQGDDGQGSIRLGQYRLLLGDNAAALEDLEKATSLTPGDADAWADLAEAKARTKDGKGAEEAYQTALRLHPTQPAALTGLGRLLVEQGRAEDAIGPLSKAISIRPNDLGTRRALAAAYQSTGEKDQALKALDTSGFDALDQSRLLADQAEVFRGTGALAEATEQLREAVRIDPTNLDARAELVEVYEEAGDEAAQEQAASWLHRVAAARIAPESELPEVLGAIDDNHFTPLLESFGSQHPETGARIRRVSFLGVSRGGDWRIQLERWLRPEQTDLRRLERDLAEALGERFSMVVPVHPESAQAIAALRDFSSDRSTIAEVNKALGTDAIAIARVRPSRSSGEPTLELRLLLGSSLTHLDGVAILANRLELSDATGYRQMNVWLLIPLTLALLLTGFVVRRGWGSLQVDIDWDLDPKKKGFFHIQLSKVPGKVQKANRKKRTGSSRGFGKKARYSRFARSLVEAQTLFRWLPARETYVCVYGLLQDEASGDVIGSFLEEKFITVSRGKLTKVHFDLCKHECAVRVRLARPDTSPDAVVQVGVRGASFPVRFVRDEETVLPLPLGQHRIVCGFEDRAFELDITVTELGSMSVRVALGAADEAVFTGCPDAVEPFVAGDLSEAADLVASAGHSQVADRMRGDFLRGQGEAGEAARLYEAAGDLNLAAEVSAESDDVQHSATLFQEAGDFKKAAESFMAAGDLERAAEAYEADYDYDSAIEAYRQTDHVEKVMELLEKTGRCFEAAVVAEEQGDGDRAIRNLQQVDLRDPDYIDATGRLAEIFAEREEWGFASEKIRAAISFAGEDLAPLNLLEKLGGYLEKAEQPSEALTVYEQILLRDFTYPGLEDRVHGLRERVALEATQLASTSAATQASNSSSGRPIDERYELLEEIGRGGMGIVYKAKDKRLGRVVALKRLPDNLRDHPTAIQLFLREARSAAALNHPNIVTLFDADETDDNYYITMELLEGHPLDQILKTRGRLRARDAALLGVQIATGLQYAHANKIIHRDIKTSNLFFTNDKVVKVMDFGLAKMVEEVRRAATVVGGTPYYMAPEQAAGEAVDHRADLYAFGVTLFELATGSVPFREGDVNYHHRHTPAPDPRERAEGIPDALAELILHLMAKSPADRPADAGEVLRRLQAIAG